MELNKWTKVYDVIVRVVEDERLHKYGPGYRDQIVLDKFPSPEKVVEEIKKKSPFVPRNANLEVVKVYLVGEGYQVVKSFPDMEQSSPPKETQEEKR